MNELAKNYSRFLLAPDEETDFKIKYGTEMYRKGFCRLGLVAPDGTLVQKAQVRVKLKKHAFRFGCNAFMLDQFPEKEQNEKYEEVFASLFNEAVIPFYWSDLEPEDGKCRYEAGSTPIYRRPPPDQVLAFCRRNNITPKGHPLCWHSYIPGWTPNDPEQFMRRLQRRLRELSARYGDEIFLWDCVNEAQAHQPLLHQRLSHDYVERVFHMADTFFPAARLIYNDNNHWWDYLGDYSPVYLLVQRLLDKGCRVGGLGLQYHMMAKYMGAPSDKFMNPRLIYGVLDQYARLQIPVNFSEVSVISRRDLGNGDLFQELVTERLYRIWFSHPAVEGVTWWNLVDGTAAYAPMGSEEGENSLRAGLVNYDFSEKPAFKVLKRLIKEEWQTDTTFDYVLYEKNMFHGFYGDYTVEVKTDAGVFTGDFHFPKSPAEDIPVRLK